MKQVLNWLAALLTFLSLAYLCIVIGMYAYQRTFLYFPENNVPSPAVLGLSYVEEVIVETPDGERLHNWYLPAKPGHPTILFFHGNGGSIAGRADRLAYYQARGFGALFVSYRGYGKSTGTSTEKGLITDALASYEWLTSKGLDEKNIFVVGESLGSAVAVGLAVQRPVAGLVIEAPFTSTIDVASATYWWLPVDLLMKDRFETIKIIDQVKVPLLIIHGALDEITDVAQGRKLFDKANQPKTLKIIDEADHNGLFVQSTWQLEVDFMTAIKPVPATSPDPA